MPLVGVLVLRAWAIPVGALAWTGLLLLGTIEMTDIPLAVALAGPNVAIGVFARWLVTCPLRRYRVVI
jgi:hypothetical protein